MHQKRILVGADAEADVKDIDLWSNVERECGLALHDDADIDEDLKREEIISVLFADQGINPFVERFYRALIMNEDYKLLVNPNVLVEQF